MRGHPAYPVFSVLVIPFLKGIYMMSEVFWVAFVSTMTGFVLKMVSMIYKSKCSKCSVCCITCERDVELEEREFEFSRLHPALPPSTPQDKNEIV
tara:strand:+ start:2196 stop:2480 length:285 start_codon:yes stop_codon:yes gene_type:complete